MKFSHLLLSALVAGAGALTAQNNAVVTTHGAQNEAIVNQQGNNKGTNALSALDAGAFITQAPGSFNNDAFIRQTGGQNRGVISQTGSNNEARSGFNFDDNGDVTNHPDPGINQRGGGNWTDINQNGDGNVAQTSAVGFQNKIVVDQDQVSNTAVVRFRGTENMGAVVQDGVGNFVEIEGRDRPAGDDPFSNEVNATQTGDFNHAILTVSGANNFIDVTQAN